MAKSEPDLIEHISSMLGRLGVKSLRAGSMRIEASSVPELEELVGAGDTIRKGDVVLVDHSTYPQRILGIFEPDGPANGPDLLYVAIDALEGTHPTSCSAWNDGLNWRRHFTRLTQEDVDAWFVESKKARPDGWHEIPYEGTTARVRTEGGVPVEIERPPERDIKHVAEEIGRILGYDLKIRSRYNDEKKTRRSVAEAHRRPIPLV